VERYLDTKTAAEFLGRSPAAVRNLVMRRAIPFRKPGGRLVFLRSELERWIQTAPGLTLTEFLKETDVNVWKSSGGG